MAASAVEVASLGGLVIYIYPPMAPVPQLRATVPNLRDEDLSLYLLIFYFD
jgi:hypothetical protein